MKHKIQLVFLFLTVLFATTHVSMAMDRWELPGIGKMKIPKSVIVENGEQEAIPFMKDKGIRLYFTRKGATEGHYYTLTYANPPDFTYGWATSQHLGIPYLLEIGKFSERNKPVDERMDLIADYLNTQLISQGAVYKGDLPICRFGEKKTHYWEGKFTLVTKERNIIYNTNYLIVLQNDGYFITLGIVCSDGDQKEFTEALDKMIRERKIDKRKKVLSAREKIEKQM